jgi:uncharacterized protein with ParB-like and HNH nuclease domain
MKAAESKLSQILTDKRTYEIPPYQRAYSWKVEHVNELMEDLYEAFENKSEEYFIGSIIAIETTKDICFEIVDGQQRLTTLTLILAKLRDLILDPVAKNTVQDRILPVDGLTSEPEQPRLLVRDKDREFFKQFVLMGNQAQSTDSETQIKMKENLSAIQHFFEDVEKFPQENGQKTLKEFAGYLIHKVSVVFVTTESFDSAYRLFNVLNARGLSLSNGDLLKNKLFGLAQDSETEKTAIKNSWDKLEDSIGLENFDTFLSHHRTSITGEKQVKTLFKDYEVILKEYIKKPSDFCAELLKSADNYKKIIDSKVADDEKIKRLIFSLKNVSYDEWIPALLAFMNNEIADISLTEFLSLLEKRTMHNWVLRLGRTKRNTIYYTTIKAINAGESGNKVIEILKEGANNKNFLDSLSTDVYGMGYAMAVLLRIECEMQDDSVYKTFSGVISVEHILPQKMKNIAYWIERFTPEQQNLWVHKLGNLTLLSGRKNSAAQNYSFDKKKEVYLKRGKKVSFDMTKQVCDETDWTIEILKKRQKELLEKAAEIWNI